MENKCYSAKFMYAFYMHHLCTFLLDYVRVGHRKMGDQMDSLCGHKIPMGSPEEVILTSKSRNMTSE